jgi:SAM-dependent methyltransferase
MMNMLYRDHAEGETLFGKALNIYATHEAAARANINRISYLGEKIRDAVAASPRERIRIASVGCGPAREITTLLTESPELGARLDVALIDQEERSIAYCERTLAPLVRKTGARIQFIRESVRKLITTRQLEQALGARELIYSAGLFDYLSDRAFAALLGTLWGAVAEGGTLAIGNVASHNPSRWMMEYILDWFLIHRSPADLERMGAALSPAPGSMHVQSEPMGVNLFLVVQR